MVVLKQHIMQMLVEVAQGVLPHQHLDQLWLVLVVWVFKLDCWTINCITSRNTGPSGNGWFAGGGGGAHGQGGTSGSVVQEVVVLVLHSPAGHSTPGTYATGKLEVGQVVALA